MTIFRWRRTVLTLVCAFCTLPAHAQRGFGPGRGLGEALFQRYPFDKWAAENAKPQIRWTTRISPPTLSPHQRLVTQLHISVDGGELRKHAASGPIAVFARIEDSAGHRYQTGNQTPVSRLHHGESYLELTYDIAAFVVPGDYFVSLAVCDGRTLEHSFVRKSLHVAAIISDPLPDAWNGLSPVEFLPSNGTPDAWYLPQVRSRIRLPLATRTPVRVELLVNTTPSELESVNSFRRNMELIVPSLKVLMGLEPANGSAGLAVVDINRHTTTWQQPDLQASGNVRIWSNLSRAFAQFNGLTVDAKTLAGQRKMLDYFAGEASRRLGPADADDGIAHALIVLSAPVYFTQQEKPPPPDLPADPRRRVFYISYSPMAIVVGAGSENAFPLNVKRPLYLFTDDIERLLKPMGARVFHVAKPEEFRKALGTILDEIGKMQIN